MEQADAVVIGAGVIGLAVARALALAGREVIVLEAQASFGTQVSARNSEVIHAGLYYPTGSLKARLCVQGRQQLYAYCAQRCIAHQRCGKLLVATSAAQLPQLQDIARRAAANGVHDLQALSAAQARALEPALHCHAALLSPATGIVDSHGLMLALLADLENAGGLLAVNSAVTALQASGGQVQLDVHSPGQHTRLQARTVVNAAGLGALALAHATQGMARPLPWPLPQQWAKGHYFSLSGRAPFTRLIYPMPEPGGLGVHLTLDLGGQAKFGPDVQWVNAPDDWQVDATRADAFYAQVRRYWPALPDGALQPGYAGIRPKLAGPQLPNADFALHGPRQHGAPGLLHLLGIESPGLTSCLAIADAALAMLNQ